MYIVAIAWLYVALMVAISATNLVGGVLDFAGMVLPLGLLLWIFGSPARRRRRARQEAEASDSIT